MVLSLLTFLGNQYLYFFNVETEEERIRYLPKARKSPDCEILFVFLCGHFWLSLGTWSSPTRDQIGATVSTDAAGAATPDP